MSYVARNLMTGETVTHTARLHWILYLTLRSILTLGLWAAIKSWTSEFAVTSRRVIVKTGLISRVTLELNLSKVESIGIDQTILGRILGYGTVIVIGTGGTREPFRFVAAPMQFRRAVMEAQEAVMPGGIPPR